MQDESDLTQISSKAHREPRDVFSGLDSDDYVGAPAFFQLAELIASVLVDEDLESQRGRTA